MTVECPVCLDPCAKAFYADGPRRYFACACCGLRFLDPAARLTAEREKARYLEHRNDSRDPGYQAFVRPLFEQACAHAPPGTSVLDFGAGPDSALARLLGEAGYRVELYDPFFHPEAGCLGLRYGFIAACEVAEHFYDPRTEFCRLRGMLSPGGALGVMTWMWGPDVDFARWHYRRDETHVLFYRPETFLKLGELAGFSGVSFPEERIALLRA